MFTVKRESSALGASTSDGILVNTVPSSFLLLRSLSTEYRMQLFSVWTEKM